MGITYVSGPCEAAAVHNREMREYVERVSRQAAELRQLADSLTMAMQIRDTTREVEPKVLDLLG